MTEPTTPSDQSARPPVRRRVRPVLSPEAQPPQTAPNKSAAPSIAEGDDKVGYRNPPKHSQFKSGFDPRRPKGRKAGARNKASSIVAMMESPTAVRTPEGGVRTISTAEALARKLRELGLQGELGAIAKAFELYHKALPPAAAEAGDKNAPSAQSPDELSASDRAILAAYEEEIAARETKSKHK